MTISGVFYTIGSLAFVRAVNEPPLKPLFPSLIHFQTDELLGRLAAVLHDMYC